jgi:hypothetical protein
LKDRRVVDVERKKTALLRAGRFFKAMNRILLMDLDASSTLPLKRTGIIGT